jgi:tetratricopeptide (TPR) repeat protein
MAVLMLAAIGTGLGLAYWGIHTHTNAEQAIQKAKEASEHAQQIEAQTKHQIEEEEKARLATLKDRDRAVADVKADEDSVKDMKEALDFFQTNVLSPDNPVTWTEPKDKHESLREVVDRAETRVTFVKRPLAQATIRELFGATYLALHEPAKAVKQYQQALALREKLQGKQHPDTCACRNQLEVAYRRADRPLDASKLIDPTQK